MGLAPTGSRSRNARTGTGVSLEAAFWLCLLSGDISWEHDGPPLAVPSSPHCRRGWGGHQHPETLSKPPGPCRDRAPACFLSPPLGSQSFGNALGKSCWFLHAAAAGPLPSSIVVGATDPCRRAGHTKQGSPTAPAEPNHRHRSCHAGSGQQNWELPSGPKPSTATRMRATAPICLRGFTRPTVLL